ncbi:MAG: DMT family transporter [Oscillospiraceae bacterium]|nr:DMT family transporter [Oscillospiraceae bacterium]
MSKQKRADLLLVVVTAFWGSSYYLSNLCLQELPPMWLTSFRFLTAFFLLAAVFFPHIRRVSAATLKYSLYVGLSLVGCYTFYGYGLTRTSLSNAGFICALPVVFTPLLDFVFHRTKPHRKLIICLVLCTAGLGLMTLNEQFRPRSGDLLCLGVAFCYAIDLLLTEEAVRRENVDPLALGVCQLGVVGVITLVLSLFIETPTLPRTPAVWASAIFLGIFCTGVAFVIQSVQQQYTTATHVGLIFTLEPVFSATVAFFLAGERLLPRAYLGAVLMLLSLVLMEIDWPTKKERA